MKWLNKYKTVILLASDCHSNSFVSSASELIYSRISNLLNYMDNVSIYKFRALLFHLDVLLLV